MLTLFRRDCELPGQVQRLDRLGLHVRPSGTAVFVLFVTEGEVSGHLYRLDKLGRHARSAAVVGDTANAKIARSANAIGVLIF